MKKLWIRLVGWLLHIANSGCGGVDFYALKDDLQARYGVTVGKQLQHIVKECWGCHGTGKFDPYDNEYATYQHLRGKHLTTCRRCCGTGTFDEFWAVLEVFSIGDYTFHRPIQKLYKKPDEMPVDIEGKIDHKYPRRHGATEALFWLSLIYNRKRAKAILFAECYRHNAIYPATLLANLIAGFTWYWPLKIQDALNKRKRHKNKRLTELPF